MSSPLGPQEPDGRVLMRLTLLGPPGSGKGTQAKLLSDRLNLEHIGTGDILREAIHLQTPSGVLAQVLMSKAGNWSRTTWSTTLVAERFHRDDRPTRFVMDGYPRTLAQARAFDKVLHKVNLPLTGVVTLNVEDEEIIRRVGGRWSCPKRNCKRTYHVEKNPPRKPGVCDKCGTELVQREDDKPETLRERLKVYHHNKEELLPYYHQQGLLHEVNGQGEIDEIYCRIVKVLNLQAGPAC